ncbi:hypothetical protein [Weissella minor]|uniref:Uncharacterized protein n=1 Tax=Weissella minor TaxID=1620 RepID=A0A0R2JIG5_9LACO|nr:hypothetical protein [Weissella minor]KRN77086.1 hypothetical protein IV67_GL000601 [Weissella minor]
MKTYLAKLLIVNSKVDLAKQQDYILKFENVMTVPYDSTAYYKAIQVNGKFRNLFESTNAHPFILDTCDFKQVIELALKHGDIRKITIETTNGDEVYEDVINEELKYIIDGTENLPLLNFKDEQNIENIYLITKTYSFSLTRLGILKCIYTNENNLIDVLKIMNSVITDA